MDKTNLEFVQQKLYTLYCMDWMINHGVTLSNLLHNVGNIVKDFALNNLDDYPNKDADELMVSDAIDHFRYESGFNGEIWASAPEFLSTEYLDKDYIERLLNFGDFTSSERELYYQNREEVLNKVTAGLKFKVGQHYTHPGLYGEIYDYTVKERSEDSIIFLNRDVNIVDLENPSPLEETILPVHLDEDNNEYVVAWEYKGHEGRIKADNREVKYIHSKEALKNTDIAIARYNDLCEYFGEAKDILNNSEEFKKWLERIRWHCKKVDGLARKMELCEDCISRQAAQAKIKNICNKYGLSYEDGERKAATGGSAYALGHVFDELPPVTPKPKTWENAQVALSRIFDRCEEIDPQSGYNMLEDIQFVRGFINKHKPQESEDK